MHGYGHIDDSIYSITRLFMADYTARIKHADG